MRFGPVPVDEAGGAVLAHTRRLDSGMIRKGTVLSEDHLAALRAEGVAEVEVARLDPVDVAEDAAARELAQAAAGPGLEVRGPFTGRANLVAVDAGVVQVAADRIGAANAVDEAVTLSTREPWAAVGAGSLVATAKIITFAVPRAVLERATRALEPDGEAPPALSVAPFRPHRAGLVLTRLPGSRDGTLEQAETVTRRRVEALGSRLDDVRVVAHEADAVAGALSELRALGCRPLLVLGASAVVDRGDVVPRAVRAAGGEILRFGIPVDPGNLLLFARWGRDVVLGVPGCARSPKRSGFDTVLERVLAGVDVRPESLSGLAVGGLLREISTRPQPRRGQAEEERPDQDPQRVGAVVLAAGRSSRMKGANKLGLEVDGTPMLRAVVDVVREAGVEPVVVVTGHDRELVDEVLRDLPAGAVEVVHNPHHERGMSTSLIAGFDALAPSVEGVLVCLGDMPRVSPETIRALVAHFAPGGGRPICVPVVDRKRGNPVLIGTRYLPEIRRLEGDVGARELLSRHAHMVHEVPVADRGVLLDVDTRDAMRSLGSPGPASSDPPRPP